MGRTLNIFIAVLLLAVLFIGLNMAASRLVRNARLDATEGRVFTLTAGSRNIAKSPDEPITLTFYYSAKIAQGRPQIQTYAQRVRETLEEFQRSGNGKIKLAIVDPEPFSEGEDRAVQAGLMGVPVNTDGDSLYFGLVGTNSVETRETIPFFNPEQERFLEYDIARLVHSLASPNRKVIGLVTTLPMEGGFSMDPRTRQPRQTPAWKIIDDLQANFTVRNLGQPDSIPTDVDVLLVAHPKDLSPATLYAIDQYILKGGKAMLFVDPHCESDESGNPMAGGSGDRASNLSTLLDAWGVQVLPDTVAADSTLGMRVYTQDQARPEPITYVIWLSAKKESGESILSNDDAVTGQISQINFATAGIIAAKPITPAPPATGDAAAPSTPVVTITPLIRTTSNSMKMPVDVIPTPPDPKAILRAFTPGKEQLTLAARLSGTVRSAFPSGKPAADGAAPSTVDHVASSAGSINVILVADADMLSDSLWVRDEQFFGQRTRRLMADNGAFTVGAVENLIGGTDLISLRARRESARSFTLVDTMQRRAEDRFRAEQQLLETKLTETNDRILSLSRQQGDDKGTLVLTPEVQAEIDKAKDEVLTTRKQLRDVRRSLRSDIERLGTQLKAINIALMPALVSLGAAGIGLWRRARRSA